MNPNPPINLKGIGHWGIRHSVGNVVGGRVKTKKALLLSALGLGPWALGVWSMSLNFNLRNSRTALST
jgi:hypothetical protein